MALTTLQKLEILSDAAKYDVSCSSSGSDRKNTKTGLGNSKAMGICHTYTQDGRCVSLLKILLTNHCVFDCAYCVSRKSNDVKRAAFTVDEVVALTINFYKRNFIEGLFLSSGIFKDADYTMERLVRIAKKLRTEHDFNGYIHLKAIPRASEELLYEAGLWADRLSVNIEMPSDSSLKLVAPEKSFKDALEPMEYLKGAITESKEELKKSKNAPRVAPAGQSTQLIVGASPETDRQILNLSQELYQTKNLKRVYYSGYVPISTDSRLPVINAVPLKRENRLYQADWLLRFYSYKAEELLSEDNPHLDPDLDPKTMYALRNMQLFPMNVNTASYYQLIKIPGIGTRSAQRILNARKFGKLREEHLQKIGIVWKRARFFLVCEGYNKPILEGSPLLLRQNLLGTGQNISTQLSLFA